MIMFEKVIQLFIMTATIISRVLRFLISNVLLGPLTDETEVDRIGSEIDLRAS